MSHGDPGAKRLPRRPGFGVRGRDGRPGRGRHAQLARLLPRPVDRILVAGWGSRSMDATPRRERADASQRSAEQTRYSGPPKRPLRLCGRIRDGSVWNTARLNSEEWPPEFHLESAVGRSFSLRQFRSNQSVVKHKQTALSRLVDLGRGPADREAVDRAVRCPAHGRARLQIHRCRPVQGR